MLLLIASEGTTDISMEASIASTSVLAEVETELALLRLDMEALENKTKDYNDFKDKSNAYIRNAMTIFLANMTKLRDWRRDEIDNPFRTNSSEEVKARKTKMGARSTSTRAQTQKTLSSLRDDISESNRRIKNNISDTGRLLDSHKITISNIFFIYFRI